MLGLDAEELEGEQCAASLFCLLDDSVPFLQLVFDEAIRAVLFPSDAASKKGAKKGGGGCSVL
jgi:hypothetical protein